VKSLRIVCLAGAALLATAQGASGQGAIGVKGGVNLAGMSYGGPSSFNERFENRTLWTVGVFLDMPVAKRLAIQPEALFTRKGSVHTFDQPGEGRTELATYRLDYLDLSALARVDLRRADSHIVPYGFAGPTVGIVLGATRTSTWRLLEPEADIKSDLNRTEVGIAVGGGVRFGRIIAEIRYAQAFTDVFTAAASRGAVTPRNRNSDAWRHQILTPWGRSPIDCHPEVES
jgi:hypothetical protein